MRTSLGILAILFCIPPLYAVPRAPIVPEGLDEFFRGNEVGNGGNVIRCQSNNQVSFELLDYYEGRQLWQMPPDMGSPELSVEEKAEIALQRLKNVEPIRIRNYQAKVKNFYADAAMVAGGELTKIDDTSHLILPAGCALYQMVIQREPELPGEKRYTINKDVWDQLNNDTKAGLILHEIIYGDAIRAGQTNSRTARHFNAYLASTLSEAATIKSHQQLLAIYNFPGRFAFHGFELDYASLRLHKDCTINSDCIIREGVEAGGSRVKVGDKELAVGLKSTLSLLDDEEWRECAGKVCYKVSLPDESAGGSCHSSRLSFGSLHLIENASIIIDLDTDLDRFFFKAIIGNDDGGGQVASLTNRGSYSDCSYGLLYEWEKLELYPNFKPKNLFLSKVTEFELSGQKSAKLKDRVYFHENGKVKGGTLAEPAFLMTPHGESYFSPNIFLEIDSDGVVLSPDGIVLVPES